MIIMWHMVYKRFLIYFGTLEYDLLNIIWADKLKHVSSIFGSYLGKITLITVRKNDLTCKSFILTTFMFSLLHVYSILNWIAAAVTLEMELHSINYKACGHIKLILFL